jgi:hypothetical protein
VIDKENEIFTRVKEQIVAQYHDAVVDSSYQSVPSGFPHVSLYQNDAFTPDNMLDSAYLPKYVSIGFTAQVYSNKTKGKKQECKKIMGIIADTMARMNFRMIMLTPVPNLNDSSIYRLSAQFEGMADADGFYGR